MICDNNKFVAPLSKVFGLLQGSTMLARTSPLTLAWREVGSNQGKPPPISAALGCYIGESTMFLGQKNPIPVLTNLYEDTW